MGLKSILPYEQYTFVTKLSTTEVAKRIAENTGLRPQMISFTRRDIPNTLFTGFVSGDRFELSRVIQYKNSFLPLIKGKMTPFLGKTEISISMAPMRSVLIFMCIWLGGVTMVCLGMLFYGFTNFHQVMGKGIEFPVVMPFFMWIVGVGMIIFGFRSESKRAKKMLVELLEGEA